MYCRKSSGNELLTCCLLSRLPFEVVNFRWFVYGLSRCVKAQSSIVEGVAERIAMSNREIIFFKEEDYSAKSVTSPGVWAIPLNYLFKEYRASIKAGFDKQLKIKKGLTPALTNIFSGIPGSKVFSKTLKGFDIVISNCSCYSVLGADSQYDYEVDDIKVKVTPGVKKLLNGTNFSMLFQTEVVDVQDIDNKTVCLSSELDLVQLKFPSYLIISDTAVPPIGKTNYVEFLDFIKTSTDVPLDPFVKPITMKDLLQHDLDLHPKQALRVSKQVNDLTSWLNFVGCDKKPRLINSMIDLLLSAYLKSGENGLVYVDASLKVEEFFKELTDGNN